MKVAIFSVCHNSYNESFKFLESVDRSIRYSNIWLDLYFIDNSSNECKESIEKIKNYSSNFNIFYFKINNLGYFPSINFILENNNISLEEYQYLCITNVDLSISKSFFKNLLLIKHDDKTGVIAPSILSSDVKADKNPKIVTRPSKIKLKINKLFFNYLTTYIVLKIVNIFRLKIRRKINSKLPNIKKANNDQIYAAHGSFFIFTNKFVEVENKFNYPVFLFGEEIYIAETAKANGLKTIYYPKLKIYDDEHASTSLMSSKFYRNSNYEALSYILAKYDF